MVLLKVLRHYCKTLSCASHSGSLQLRKPASRLSKPKRYLRSQATGWENYQLLICATIHGYRSRSHELRPALVCIPFLWPRIGQTVFLPLVFLGGVCSVIGSLANTTCLSHGRRQRVVESEIVSFQIAFAISVQVVSLGINLGKVALVLRTCHEKLYRICCSG